MKGLEVQGVGWLRQSDTIPPNKSSSRNRWVGLNCIQVEIHPRKWNMTLAICTWCRFSINPWSFLVQVVIIGTIKFGKPEE